MKKTLRNCTKIGFLLLSFISLNSIAQTKVLFLGNSFTYTYDIPTLFAGFANEAGISVFIDEKTEAGMAVADEQIVGHANDANSQAKISSQNWDFIVIQDNMGNYVSNIGSISANCGNANVTLYNQIKANNSCTRIIYFAGWGPEGGVTASDNTQNCINRIHGNLNFLNDNVGDEIVSPIGKCWIQSLNQMPSVDLFYSDNVHPSLAGSYLAAASIFTSIFKVNPTTLNYTGGVNSTTASNMRQIAWSQVTNATIINQTNLNSFTPVITASGTTLTCSGFSAPYQWYLNGTAISGATASTYTATTNGNYTVEGTGTDGCQDISFVFELAGVGINENEIKQSFEITKISNTTFELNSNVMGTVYVYNLNGQLLFTDTKTTEIHQINMEAIANGLYYFSIINDTKKISKKIAVVN